MGVGIAGFASNVVVVVVGIARRPTRRRGAGMVETFLLAAGLLLLERRKIWRSARAGENVQDVCRIFHFSFELYLVGKRLGLAVMYFVPA